jgi:hypothetical protein
MSMPAYSLPSSAFRPLDSPNQQASENFIESLRYVLRRIVSCWHLQMSRPFTLGGHTYRICSKCGLRRDFDLHTWSMKGRYYRDPS